MSAGKQLQRIDAQVGCCCWGSGASVLLVLNSPLLLQLVTVRLHMASRTVELIAVLLRLQCWLQADGMAATVMHTVCNHAVALVPIVDDWSCLVV